MTKQILFFVFMLAYLACTFMFDQIPTPILFLWMYLVPLGCLLFYSDSRVKFTLLIILMVFYTPIDIVWLYHHGNSFSEFGKGLSGPLFISRFGLGGLIFFSIIIPISLFLLRYWYYQKTDKNIDTSVHQMD